MGNILRWIAVLPASLVACALAEFLLILLFMLQNWLCYFSSYTRFTYVENVRESALHNIMLGLGAVYASSHIAEAIAPRYKKIVGIIISSFLAAYYFFIYLRYGNANVVFQVIGTLIAIPIMVFEYRNQKDQ